MLCKSYFTGTKGLPRFNDFNSSFHGNILKGKTLSITATGYLKVMENVMCEIIKWTEAVTN